MIIERTVDDCAREVLARLGAVTAGQAPPHEDILSALSAVRSAAIEMAARNIVVLDSEDIVSPLYFDALASYSAALLAPTYGQNTFNGMSLDAAQEAALFKARKLKPEYQTGPDGLADFY